MCGASVPASAEGGQVNVALAELGAVAVADSEYRDQTAALAIDGKWIGPGDAPDANRWHSALERRHPHWLWVRFRQPARISRVVLHRADPACYPVDFVGEYSPDNGRSFRTLFGVTGNIMGPDEFAVERSFTPVVADSLRLRITRSSFELHPDYAQLSEVEVFGDFMEKSAEPVEPRADGTALPEPRLRPAGARGVEIRESEAEVEFRSKWLRLVFSRAHPWITAICWDSLGEGKVEENLLKPDHGVSIGLGTLFPEEQPEQRPTVEIEGNVVRYTVALPRGIRARWETRVAEKSLRMVLTYSVGTQALVKEPLGLRFAFDVSKTPVAPLANPRPGASAPLPCILHASDYGSLLLQRAGKGELHLAGQTLRHLAQWNASVVGDVRPNADGLYTLAQGLSSCEFTASVESVTPLPELTGDDQRLSSLPRHWLNTFQYRPDIGIMANNIVSDNAIFCMHTFTDPAVFTPTLPGGIDAIELARESLDRYFAGASGYGLGWEDIETETYPSLLISAWDVIRVTGDMALLRRWLPKLEEIVEKIELQDRNGNALPESTKPGTRGVVHYPSSNWWDQINFGHEDAYSCALAYRAINCAADLLELAGDTKKARHCQDFAARIKVAYLPNFLNPQTGIIAGWRDANGELHDYWFAFVNGIAIVNGLVPDDQANAIADRIEAKMREVGYASFHLGLPGNLVPIPKNDYGVGCLGSPQQDDGADTFGVFENGGATASFAYYYIQALYKLGRREEADRILWPMMRTYGEGGFQNGIGHGGEWRHWDGRPSGYEGFLADAYMSQMALFTGYYGIGFGPEGFRLQPWSPLKGKTVSLGLRYMGKTVDSVR